MNDTTRWESIKTDGEQLVDKLKALIHEGNIRRVLVVHEGRTVAEFPLTAGIVGVVIAPVLAAVGVLAAMIGDCTVQVERAAAEADAADKGKHAA